MKMKNFAKSIIAVAFVAASASVFAENAPFNATITLTQPLTVTNVNDLVFVDQTAGSLATVVTAPADVGAATFTATGEALSSVTGSVVEPSINMITGGGAGATEIIVVDNFTFGGDLDAAGAGAFDAGGAMADIRVGGTANVEADDVAGDYTGTATFRLVYL